MRTLLFNQTTFPGSVSGRFRRRRLHDHAVGRESAAATRPGAAHLAGARSIVLGVAVAGTSALGPLVLNVIRFRTSDAMRNQFIGGEVATLGVLAPLLIVSGVLYWRGRRLAPLIAIGPTLAVVYTDTTVVLGQEWARYPGNIEHWLPLYTALVVGAGFAAWQAWTRIAVISPSGVEKRATRLLAGLVAGIGILFALAWAAQIRDWYAGHPTSEALEAPTLFWLIKFLDFTVTIPAMVAAGVLTLRGESRGMRLLMAVGPFTACTLASVCGMAIAMTVKDDPAASLAMLVGTAMATVAVGGLCANVIRGQMATAPPNS